MLRQAFRAAPLRAVQPALVAPAACCGLRRMSAAAAGLSGKVALVSGSTSGIGLSMAESLASAGCDIVLNGFGDPDEIKKLEADMASTYGVKTLYIGADLTSADAIKAICDEATAKLGKVDILVNNAGIQYVAPIVDFPEAKWDQVISLNLTACFHTTKAVLPGMMERGYGRILNIASAHGRVASLNKSAYCAAKHGVVGLTKTTALETAGTGVTAVSICPGWVLTPLVKKQIEARAAEKGTTFEEETKALVSEKHPSGQAAKPEDFGALCVFLASGAGDQITGTEISIDGGWMAQ